MSTKLPHVSELSTGQWTIMTWDEDRDIWLEGKTYQTRPIAAAALKDKLRPGPQLRLPADLCARLDAQRAPGQTRVGLLCYLLELGLDQTGGRSER